MQNEEWWNPGGVGLSPGSRRGPAILNSKIFILNSGGGCYLFRRMKDGVEKLKMRLPAILLLAATLLFWGFYDRYETAGPVLLESPALADASRIRGDCAGTNGHFVLSVPEGGKTASLNFRMPAATGHDRIRARGRIKLDGVVAGKYRWSCARLMLTQYDASNKWIPGHHSLKSEQGSMDWKSYKQVFEVVPEAAHIDLVIQQIGLSGTAEFDSLVAEPVRLRRSFAWWRTVFSSLWICMGILYFRRCRLDRRKLRVLILLNAVAILAGTMMPGKWIEDTTDHLKEAVARAVEKPAPPRPVVQSLEKPAKRPVRELKRIDQFNEAVGGVHKAGHFVLFASLCFLVYLSAALERQHASYYFKVAFDILLFAAVTESLQHLTLDRAAGILDWRTDVYGLLTGLAVFLVVRFFSRIGKSKGRFGV